MSIYFYETNVSEQRYLSIHLPDENLHFSVDSLTTAGQARKIADDAEIVGGERSGENIAALLAFHAGECQMRVRKNERAVVTQFHAETLRLRVLVPADELLLFAVGTGLCAGTRTRRRSVSAWN